MSRRLRQLQQALVQAAHRSIYGPCLAATKKDLDLKPAVAQVVHEMPNACLLYTSPSPRD